ncbi:DUF421 domain-containing protein [Falsibacillus albus]|uniref:DUF421 domain-containing protein n=1 Tax=Falsibacillus albus TaxID=2478915 RepID=A0A3L7K268_9BACI|nr:DUF421 domain-containing protein [Falsibacillus albus]RLQ97156.1 DUF421 domain-containing protein [Falsibacillus albus]
MDYLHIALELFVGYIALFILTKILGKTQITQITAFDFISALILGELVGNALYDGKIGVKQILFAVILWGLFIFLTEYITQKVRKARHFLEGTPTIVIHKGKINYEALKKNNLDINQLQHLLRTKDVFSIRDCEYAFLESDGTISIMKKSLCQNVTREDLNIAPSPVNIPMSVVLDGKIIYDNVKLINKNESWLLNELSIHGFQDPKEVFFAEWKEGEPLFVQGYHIDHQ